MKSSGFKIFIISGLILVSTGFTATEKKYERLIQKADRYYQNFVYTKAVEVYEKAIELKEEDQSVFDVESALKIADSYRLMNQPISAEKWYQKVVDREIMTDQDKMNYAQVLLKLGKDNNAKSVIDNMNNADLADIDRLKSIDELGSFYTDSMAYFIENININSEEADFSPAYYQDGIAFVSNRPNRKLNQNTYYWDDSYFLDLYYTSDVDGVNSKPEVMSKRINSIFHEGPSVFIEDDQKIIFTRNNFSLGESHTSTDGIVKMKLYTAEKLKNGKWSKPTELPFNDDDYTTSSPTFSPDGQTMYFHADLPGTVGKTDIFKVSYLNDEWGTPESLGDIINTTEDEKFPFVGEDNTLYFASAGHSGIGGLDIYKVNLDDPSLEVTNMGFPVNTQKDDFGLIIDGNQGYLSSNRDGGKGSDDIYKFIIYIYDLQANIIDEDTKELLTGTLDVYDKGADEIVAQVENGSSVSFQSYRGRNLVLKGSSEGYLDGTMDFFTGDIPLESMSYSIDLEMKRPNLKGDIIVVDNYGREKQVIDARETIATYDGSVDDLKADFEKEYYNVKNLFELTAVYYDFDKSNIRKDAAEGLDDLVDVLESHKELKVTLSGHTDIRGPRWYNERLSKSRVDSARAYLLSKGISEDRIITDYKGELNPVEACKNCSEDAHQLNRRTEIYLSL
jgi:outer membrane protein OmpA-like peptidoglycan-associated protein